MAVAFLKTSGSLISCWNSTTGKQLLTRYRKAIWILEYTLCGGDSIPTSQSNLTEDV